MRPLRPDRCAATGLTHHIPPRPLAAGLRSRIPGPDDRFRQDVVRRRRQPLRWLRSPECGQPDCRIGRRL